MTHDHEHETIRHGDRAPSCNLVIFGGGGDLTKRLLMPALYNLSRTGLLPEHFSLIGVDRLELSDEAFRAQIEEAVRAFGNDKHYAQKLDESHLQRLLSCITYLQGDFSDPGCYARLKDRLASHAVSQQTGSNVVFYLAVAARFFGGIVDQLGASGLAAEAPGQWRRVVVEKPFGHNVESAKLLNTQLRRSLAERQIYRMDHFLGKETVQNIMLMRFANGIFEPLWNRDHIDHIQITVTETVGVERRAGFYETTGALRDMVPNHIFQLLALVGMEPPAAFTADAIRTEKTKVLTAVHPMNAATDSVRGQYAAGARDGQSLRAYREEEGVASASMTETYTAMKLTVDNWRWAGVPFYLRTGKALAKRNSEIYIQFKRPPLSLFKDTATESLTPNALVLKLQPDEGAQLSFGAKIPGPAISIGQVHMDFHYGDYFQNAPSTGYETLIYDCMIGDATLFQRSDSVMAGWEIVQPALDYWANDPSAPLAFYAAGSDGPTEAEALLQSSGRSWRPVNV
jgi:glucose-6-phosphate 1-dehydrogenase